MSASVTDAFRCRAARSPDAVALSAGQGSVSYGELDRWSDALAGELVEAGVRPGDRVAVCLERSPQLVVALLGVLKAGAAYVPIDPDDPESRVSMMLSDAQVSLVVGQFFAGFTTLKVPPPDGGSPNEVHSGASGRAAGRSRLPDVHLGFHGQTEVGHGRAPQHHEPGHRAELPRHLGRRTGSCSSPPVAFDAATFEIWGALLNGARAGARPARRGAGGGAR